MTVSISSATASITEEDLETLRAINASFTGGSLFSEDDEVAIEPIVHTQRTLRDEWTRREDIRTIEALFEIAWAGECASFMWIHEGICLSFTTCDMSTDPAGFVWVKTRDLAVIARGAEYHLPATRMLAFSMHDLRIPQELLDHLADAIS